MPEYRLTAARRSMMVTLGGRTRAASSPDAMCYPRGYFQAERLSHHPQPDPEHLRRRLDKQSQFALDDRLREAEERFRAQYKAIPVPTFSWRWDGEDFVLSEYNLAAEAITMGGVCKMVGRRASEVYADEPQLLDAIAKCFQSGAVFKKGFLYRFRSIDLVRELVCTFAFVPPDTVMVHLEDVTERKRAQESLKRYAERLQALHELDRSILRARSPETTARAALRRIRRIFPCKAAALLVCDEGTGAVRVLAAEGAGAASVAAGDASGPACLMRDAGLGAGRFEVVNDIACQRPRSSLSRAWNRQGLRSYLAVPLTSRHSKSTRRTSKGTGPYPVGVLLLCSDQTEAFDDEKMEIARETAAQLAIALQQQGFVEQIKRHAAELEQRVEERTAELREKNAALRAFAGTISHDIRTPLRGLHDLGRVLLDDYGPRLDAEVRDGLTSMLEAARHIDEMTGDLLEYTRLSRQQIRLRAVELEDVVVRALAELGHELRSREASVMVERPLPTVTGDLPILVQAVRNLVSNATKFVSAGTRPSVTIRAETRGHRIELHVEDNGIGISPENCDRIFNIFERLHSMEEFPGTGVGLALVRKAAHRLGGRAGVRSTPGRGSDFWISLRRPA